MDIFQEGNESVTGMFVGLITMILFFAAIILSVYFYLRARNKERLALIEKGVDISDLYKGKRTQSLFKWGIILIGFAIGLFFGYLLDTYTTMNDEVAYFTMIFLFGGASFIAYHFINKKQLDG